MFSTNISGGFEKIKHSNAPQQNFSYTLVNQKNAEKV